MWSQDWHAALAAGSGFRVPAQPQMSISSLAPTAAPKPGVCACIPSGAVGQIRKEERRETKTGTEKYKETEEAETDTERDGTQEGLTHLPCLPPSWGPWNLLASTPDPFPPSPLTPSRKRLIHCPPPHRILGWNPSPGADLCVTSDRRLSLSGLSLSICEMRTPTRAVLLAA